MTIPKSYSQLSTDFARARSWATSVVSGNRCAMVVGIAVGLSPGKGDLTMAEVNGKSSGLDKYFLRATDLAIAMLKHFGAPDVKGSGLSVLKKIDNKPGVIYLEDCWKTAGEKFNSVVYGVDTRSGDHMDLWTGKTLDIYFDDPNWPNMVGRSKKVWLWQATRR